MKKIWVNLLFVSTVTFGIYSCDSEAKRSTEEAVSTTTPVETTNQEPTTQASTQPEEAAVTAAIKFEETEYDFGTIKEGDLVNHTFKFTNTGSVPLIIQNATAQCGCTVPQKPEKPIAPGQTGEIKVEFNSKGKTGVQNKAVSVYANTQPEVTQVILKGTVEGSPVSNMQGPFKAN